MVGCPKIVTYSRVMCRETVGWAFAQVMVPIMDGGATKGALKQVENRNDCEKFWIIILLVPGKIVLRYEHFKCEITFKKLLI